VGANSYEITCWIFQLLKELTMSHDANYRPSRRQIKQACQRIQEQWSPLEQVERRRQARALKRRLALAIQSMTGLGASFFYTSGLAARGQN
jgi:hypothetical protein